MLSKVAVVSLAFALAEAAAPQGFNYGSLKSDQSPYQQSEFESMFKQAQNLPGAQGFNSARLYTMMQGGTTDQVISAIPAAISTKTRLLLGMWISDTNNDDDDTAFNNEMTVLKSAISQYGDQIKDLVDGLSVGNEDMYRISEMGLTNDNAGPGKSPKKVAEYIGKVKDALKGGPLANVPIGHIDTWTAWDNSSNKDAVTACDFLGSDAYPYWQNTVANGIDNGRSLFDEALGRVKAQSQGKPVWITETGWPVKGKSQNQATASTDNAKKFWQDVGCGELFGQVPTWWYTMMEQPTGDNPDFSVFDSGAGKPYFDLSCSGVSQSNSTSSNGTSTATGTSSSSTGTTTGTGSGSSNGTYTSGSPSAPSTGSGSGSSGSGSGSSGSGSSGSGSGSGSSGSGSGTASGSPSASGSGIATAGAATMGVYSVGTLMALAGAVAALL